MVEPFSPDGPRHVLSELCRLASYRAPAEETILTSFQERDKQADDELRQAENRLTETHRTDRTAAEQEQESLRKDVVAHCDSELVAIQEQYDTARETILAEFEEGKTAVEKEHHEQQWEANAIAEAAKGGSGAPLKELQANVENRWNELQEIRKNAIDLLDRWGQARNMPEPQVTDTLIERHPMRRFSLAVEQARAQMRTLSGLIAPRFFQGLRPLGIFFLLWAVSAVPAGSSLGWTSWHWVAISCAGSFAAFGVFGGGLWIWARFRCRESYLALRRTLLEAGVEHPTILETAKTDCQRLYAAIDSRYRNDVKRAGDKFAAVMAELTQTKTTRLAEIEAKYPPRLGELSRQREAALRQIEDKYPALFRQIDDRFESELARVREDHAHRIRQSREQFEQQWAEMAERWHTGLAAFQEAVGEIGRQCGERFPDWSGLAIPGWSLPNEAPPAVPLGRIKVELARLRGGIPRDQRLAPPQNESTLPLLLPLPAHTLLMFKTDYEGRARAVEAIQAIMLRLLAGMPPGKIRFTILDPVGLGENFSAFMHLADYDEQLVASRIWTDSDHIEQRLADLTQHMETVIQVYLRNEYQSIQEYNASAGEMAEPYRVLVVADFPANFSEVAAQRLKSIVASGARCGVFVLMSVDTKLPAPHNFRLADLESGGMVLQWKDGQFVWKHPDYGPVTVEVDRPPPADRFTEIVRAVGREVKDAGRVEVPFRCVVPTDNDWWTMDSRAGLEVPLGRAGAKKLQALDLGRGTSQHVLIAGKTGSGKSTLLHVMITNLALRYSPDEVELYLIDFKKGVEFKAYARYSLPHARVIAIESEREFGLSALQRLDAELRARGDLFRKLGVQDIKGYRNAQPEARMPRIMLVVDEFQELFVEDDRIAQECGLLLDRLVRQGRAFGIHVFLGSQTLGGAYSLARSTIGQMAVRIALQCSEGDAHLILSEENTAARLLNRPGEAIYNDANGRYEGNHPFQIVWLADDLRDDYLERISELACRRKLQHAPIVFEGNVPSDPRENPLLMDLLTAEVWPESPATPTAWLGAAVAIKDPTAALFVHQAGSNLLLVGHREEASLGTMVTAMIGLAAQHRPAADSGTTSADAARFYVFDGTRADAPEAGFWGRMKDTLPHQVTVADPRDAVKVVAELADVLARRQEEGSQHHAPIYLFVYNLGRFRDLRKEDDFGYGSDDKPSSPGKQFSALLREGAAVGIHAIVWADSHATLNRILDRQALRDFEMRVLFQMNATDSSSLMDTPDASRLGPHRAIYYDEARGQIEKFRPYGLPTSDWLSYVRKQLSARAE